jgi:hypothetical protein
MTDFEPFDKIKSNISSVPTSTWYKEMKRCLFIFILFLLINSQVFISQILSKFPDATDSGYNTNNKGVIIQGIILTLVYLCISILVDQEWV